MRTLRLVTFVAVGMFLSVAIMRASEKAKASTPSPSKAAAAQSPGASAATTGGGKASPDARTSRDAKAPHDVKRSEGQAKTGTATSPGAAAHAQTPREETLEEIVARVRRRLAMESAPAKRTAPSAAAVPVKTSERVTLVWRPYVVWPEELTGGPSAPASPQSERVTLDWDEDR